MIRSNREMNRPIKAVLFILGVMLFTGGACPSNDTTASNKVAQSEIYQSYSIAQNGHNYDVTAYFRVGGKTGTTLALIAPSTVNFNGQKMQEHLNTPSGTYYTATIPNNTPSGTFDFTDRNGKTYTNKIDLSQVDAVTAGLRVNGSAPVSIALSRPPADSAGLRVELGDHTIFVETAQTGLTEAYYDKVKNRIVILPAAWKDVANGTVAVELEVDQFISAQQATALGGDISFKYKAAPMKLTLQKAKVGKPSSKSKTAAADR
jgi:hypothetical protein